MKADRIILIVIGILLIIVQLLGFIGMSRMEVGLYPSSETLSRVEQSSEQSNLNIKMVLFAITAGTDRFVSSFEDLTFPEDEHRVTSAEQYTSAYLRESLGCSSDGSLGLFVYDTVLTISYYLIGIFGVVLLRFAIKGDRRTEESN